MAMRPRHPTKLLAVFGAAIVDLARRIASQG
jgi:hypothetical protein